MKDKKITVNLLGVIFWTTFCLVYFYINQLLIIATLDKFRLGMLALVFGLIIVIFYQKVIVYDVLFISILLFSITILISAFINNTPILQILAFLRIPIIFYLIYNLVSQFFDSEQHVMRVIKVLLILAVLQLPLILIQRVIYPQLPSRVTLGLSPTDFGMGTFSGDTAMAFTLIGLVILLLFANKSFGVGKYRWVLALWLSLTVLVSNSQIQHVTILLVWAVYLLSHLRLKTILLLITILVILGSLIIFLSQVGVMTYPLLQNTLIKISAISQIFSEEIDYDVFLSGGYARGEAVSYYLNQPLKWLGDGPGSVYDTVTGRRTVGSFGHAFTFYAEVGLVGWLLSILIFFVVAFPMHIKLSSAKIRVGWVGALMFLAVMVVSIVKYPMGDISLVFTFCVILVGYQVRSRSMSSERYQP